jgi:histone-lysine N-methyltransferase SUV420H
VYFWTTIRKNRSKYSSARGICEDDVTAILLRDLIVGKDPQLAEESLLKLPGLRKFDNSLETKGEKDHFRRHLRKYINIWLPDCPFEVSTTNRYTIVTQEAATTARRFIKKNEPIKYLCGHLVSMTPEEEEALDQSKRDFSIVMSSRKKTASLFMGPARFANHDCNANARLVTKGFDGMQVVAVRDINLGEEITVTYGNSYFGEANSECLCMTCEKECRNGWTSPQQDGKPSRVAMPMTGLEEDVSPSPYSFRKTRKYSQLMESTPSATPDTGESLSPRKRRKIRTGDGTISLYVERRGEIQAEPSRPSMSSEILKNGVETSTDFQGPPDEDVLRSCVTAAFAKNINNDNQTEHGKTHAYQSENSSPRASSVHLLESTALDKVIRALSPLLTSSELSSESSTALSVVTSVGHSHAQTSPSPATTLSTTMEPELVWKSANARLNPVSESDLSDLSANEFLDDIAKVVIRKPKKRGRPVGWKAKKVIPTIELERPIREIRYPNDYVRTPLLLGESYSRWVDCKTCAGCWVQPNGYLTRKECPRCERHSKLYGYQWPKTDKYGKADKEERVLDHRTVHRFLRPEEEALVKKRGRGVRGPRERITTILKQDMGVGKTASTAKKG